MVEGFAIFTNFKDTDGKFGIGQVPGEIQSKTDFLCKKFYNEIPKDKLQSKTYHKWFNEFSPDIKPIVESIQKNPFWNELCTKSGCTVINISEMDELYYSKAPSKGSRDLFLYGATGNYEPHIDGVFNFPGMHFYRVLIGLTPDNSKVETRFLKLGVNHKLQKNDYIVFDFDKAEHQVVNHETDTEKDKKNYRIMLKLHFLVCDDCTSENLYMNVVKQSYISYETVTRYFMQVGTDPTTPYEFMVGIVDMIWNRLFIVAFICFIAFWAFPLTYLWKRNYLWKSRLFYFNATWLGGIFGVSLLLWIRYLITGLR
jgi:hypothetical protein